MAAGDGLGATGECKHTMVTIGGKVGKCWTELKVSCDEGKICAGIYGN
jgi:hypothetical protein